MNMSTLYNASLIGLSLTSFILLCITIYIAFINIPRSNLKINKKEEKADQVEQYPFKTWLFIDRKDYDGVSWFNAHRNCIPYLKEMETKYNLELYFDNDPIKKQKFAIIHDKRDDTWKAVYAGKADVNGFYGTIMKEMEYLGTRKDK